MGFTQLCAETVPMMLAPWSILMLVWPCWVVLLARNWKNNANWCRKNDKLKWLCARYSNLITQQIDYCTLASESTGGAASRTRKVNERTWSNGARCSSAWRCFDCGSIHFPKANSWRRLPCDSPRSMYPSHHSSNVFHFGTELAHFSLFSIGPLPQGKVILKLSNLKIRPVSKHLLIIAVNTANPLFIKC